jgi:hypothetical protein
MRKQLLIASISVLAVFFLTSALQGNTVNGIIEEGEYQSSVEYAQGQYRLFWSIRDEIVYFGISADTQGWVAVGFDPVEAMKDADMVMGLVDDNGTVSVIDIYSIGPNGPHIPDEELGGRQHILESAGTEHDGATTIEFSRKRRTGDEFDKVFFPEGGNKIIWAFGFSDDPEDFHAERGYGLITEAEGEIVVPITSRLLLIHIFTMSLSFLLMAFGIAVPRYMKKHRWWLKTHRSIEISGASLGVVGVGTGITMVQLLSGLHFRVVHSYFGFATIVLILLAPVLGQMIFKGKRERKPAFRKWHRRIGRIALLLMLATIVLGLMQAGIL